MAVDSQYEAIITWTIAGVVFVLVSMLGALFGSVLNTALHAIRDSLKPLLVNLTATAPEPLVPSQMIEATLLAMNIALAVAGAIADIEELIASLSFVTTFLSLAATVLFQNPLHIFPLLLMFLIRVFRVRYS
jgi:hypothetical protein